MNRKKVFFITIFVIAIFACAYLLFHAVRSSPSVSAPASGTLRVVAAENFWGSLASQIGGSRAQVLSVVSDPNADPHEYETDAADARAVAGANYVIENGAGYDSWMGKLLNADTGSAANRKVLDVAVLLGKKNGDNPHFWYGPDYVNAAAAQMEKDFVALDPANAAYYETRYAELQVSLAKYQDRIAAIKTQFGGTKVATTEDIFVYLANAAGLDLVSPPAFTEAVAEGNDPPAASVVQFGDQLKAGEVKVLVYNEQTVTPLTSNMRAIATGEGIPTVGVTETIQPPAMPFEDWMDAQVAALQQALGANTSMK